jgi:poly-beta-1,6-N-acetyl-D-glucosamine synthase
MPWFEAAEAGVPLLLLLIPGLPLGLLGLVQLLALPMALGFELRAVMRRRRGMPTLWDEWPSVSIIVPARNAAPVIEDCVRSIARTRYNRYEVILVDDGSTDNTAELMARFAAADRRIKVLRQRGGGRAAARNLGMRHAAGDILMFVDADATFSRDTVDRMLQAFEDGRTGAVYGGGSPAHWTQGLGGLLSAISQLGSTTTRRAMAVAGGLLFVPGGIAAFPGTVLAEIGPFRENPAGAELELAWRVREAGYTVAFAPRVRIQAASPSALRDLWQLRTQRAHSLLHTLTARRGVAGTLWPGILLRHRWLVPLIPVYSASTVLFMLAGLARHVRGLAGHRDKRPAVSAGSGEERDVDAWRALREAWA